MSASHQIMSVVDVRNGSLVKLSTNHDGVALLELRRAEKRNALSQAMIRDINSAISRIEADNSVRCVVLTSPEGCPFSTGADLAELVRIGTSQAYRQAYLQDLNDAVSSMRKPIVAAVVGFAYGGGFELAMGCDIIYAAAGTLFGLPELSVGTMPGCGGTQRLTRVKAMDLILTSSSITGAELRALGGIARVFATDEEVRSAAMASAATIAAKSGPVVQLAKESIRNAARVGIDDGMRLERGLYYGSFSLQDKAEGMTAFIEKREAVFKHR